MFKFVVVCALLACVYAQHYGGGHAQAHADHRDESHAETLKEEAEVDEHGFHYGYETSNGIRAFSEGDEHGNHRGEFGWDSPEGEHISVKFVANEDGYQPESDVLPTPHPIPEYILRALKYIEEHSHDEAPAHGGRKF